MKIDKITKNYFFWLKIVSESNCSHGHILWEITILELFCQRDNVLYTKVNTYVYLLPFCHFQAKFTNVCPLIVLIFHWELENSVILTLCLSKKALFYNVVLFKPKLHSISSFVFYFCCFQAKFISRNWYSTRRPFVLFGIKSECIFRKKWDQHYTWLSVKKVWKMLDIIIAFWGKKSTFGVLGVGSCTFVIPFRFKITLYYRSK